MNMYWAGEIPTSVAQAIKRHSPFGAHLAVAESPVDLYSKASLQSSQTDEFDASGTVCVCLKATNDALRINKLHEGFNEVLSVGDIYVSCTEYLDVRKAAIEARHESALTRQAAKVWDFLFHRACQKLSLTKRSYFRITGGVGRPQSRAEALGRLISCGFEILEEVDDLGLCYVIARKKGAPSLNMTPSFSLLCRMPRVGYQGKTIFVYKLRTMHPYSEYLHGQLLAENKFSASGKIAYDYRITEWGKILRKFWIDELPMIINLCKGELSIVGVRPLSKVMFESYPERIQRLRVLAKPGLIPPFYADLPQSIEDVIDSEEQYLLAKLERPVRTDWLYFCKAFNNIFLNGARSG